MTGSVWFWLVGFFVFGVLTGVVSVFLWQYLTDPFADLE